MGVLFFGPEINKPSQLWMRRMLEGIGKDVALLVDFMEVGSDYRSRFDVFILGNKKINWPPVIRRLQYYQERRNHEKLLLSAMARSDVNCAVIHYLVYAVRYRNVWRRICKPVYVHCHGMDVTWDLKSHYRKWPRKKIYSARYARLARNLPGNVAFIANSVNTQKRLESIGIPADRITVKYLGVPVPEQFPRRCAADGRRTILYLGRLVDFKGPDLVVKAFSRACEMGLQANLEIAGDGPLRPAAEALARMSPFSERIKFLGAVGERQGEALRKKADIFTAHNRPGPVSGQDEAFGVAFVEAMAAGLPVVTGRSGAIPEIIDDGIEGILFAPGNIEAHARAILKLARDPELRKEMGVRGWNRVKIQFSLEREIRELRKILKLE